MVVQFAFLYHTFQGAFWQLFPLTLSSSFVRTLNLALIPLFRHSRFLSYQVKIQFWSEPQQELEYLVEIPNQFHQDWKNKVINM